MQLRVYMFIIKYDTLQSALRLIFIRSAIAFHFQKRYCISKPVVSHSATFLTTESRSSFRRVRGEMMERSKYANYRYSNYVQDGVAVLKIGSDPVAPPKSTNNGLLDNNRNSSTVYSVKFGFTPRVNLSDPPTTEGRLNSRRNKLLYNDKAVRTTKNFIGKSCYNVGLHSTDFYRFRDCRDWRDSSSARC